VGRHCAVRPPHPLAAKRQLERHRRGLGARSGQRLGRQTEVNEDLLRNVLLLDAGNDPHRTTSMTKTRFNSAAKIDEAEHFLSRRAANRHQRLNRRRLPRGGGERRRPASLMMDSSNLSTTRAARRMRVAGRAGGRGRSLR
jgi:hypothetical protein